MTPPDDDVARVATPLPGRRVAVTGIGALSALGEGRAALWDAVSAGRCGIGPITAVDTADLGFANGAEVRGFEARRFFDKRSADLLDRFAQFLVVAARQALADAALTAGDLDPCRTAVITGSCLGGQVSEDALYHDLYGRGRKRMPPLSIPRAMANAGASQVTLELGVTGPAFTLSTACSSSSHAIGLAFWMVRQGTVDRALAGGSEAPFCFGNLKGWEALRTVAPDTCRPFSADRKGMILGEGGAMLVLESLEAARARGVPILAEIVGFGMGADAHHITSPSADGAARAMEAALADGRVAPSEIDYINAHGTGTAINDPTETRAIRQVFGPHAERLAVSSTKSMHGHALGAAGAIEGAITVLALHRGLLPPTVNFTTPDPACDLDVVANRARPATLRAALSNSLAFGGLNAVLAFRRYSGQASSSSGEEAGKRRRV